MSDVRFDASAAEQLIYQMDLYCTGVQTEAKDLLSVLNESGDWKDNQMEAFHRNMIALASDLDRALKLESEYMRTYHQRVRELKGN